MKCLIILSAVVAVSLAKPGYLSGGVAGLAGHLGYAGGFAAPAAYGAGYAYHGPQHLPVITPAGVPVDTPDVQAARAAHAVAYGHAATAAALSGPGIAHAAGAPAVAAYGAPHAAALSGSGIAHAAGPALAAYGAPLAAAGAYGHGGYAYHGPQHIPVLTAAGVPVDTPEVQAARAADAAAHLAAKARHG